MNYEKYNYKDFNYSHRSSNRCNCLFFTLGSICLLWSSYVSMNNNGKVLFNEKCAICNFEIQHYKKRSLLEFSDCSQMDDKYLKKLHVIFTDGKELAGIDAFIYVWNRTDGYGWLGKIVALPLIKQVAIILYSILAFALYWRFKLFNNN